MSRTPLPPGQAAVLLVATLALFRAAGPPEAAGRLRWEASGSASVGVEFNDNVNLASGEEGEEPLDDVITVAAPGFSFEVTERDDLLRISYLGEYRSYSQGSREDGWFHEARAELVLRRLAPLVLLVNEQREMSPRRLDLPEEEAANLIHHNILEVRPSLEWSLAGNTDLEIFFEERRESFPGEPGADSITSRDAGLAVARNWSRTAESSLSVSGGRTTRRLGEDFDVLASGIAGTWSLSPALDVSLGLTWEQRTPGEGDPEQYWLKHAAVTRRIGRFGLVLLSYDDRLDTRFDGDTLETGRLSLEGSWNREPWALLLALRRVDRTYRVSGRSEEAFGPEAGVSVRLRPNLRLVTRAGWTRTESDPEGSRQDLLLAEGRLVLGLGDHVEIETGVGLADNEAMAPARPYRNQRQWVMVTGRF